jgi:hypothetical protein
MNRNIRYISLKEIINRVYKDGGDIVEDLTEDDVVLDTIELLGIVGVPQLFETKYDTLIVKKYRAALPCDFVDLIALKDCGRPLNASTDKFDVTDSRTLVTTYRIDGDIIKFSKEEGYIQIAYTAVKVDDDGYPMIVNDQTFIRALVSYIIYKRVYSNYINGRLPNENIMERVERNYEFNIAQATNRLTMPSEDELNNIARMMNSFIFRCNARKTGFKNIGDELPDIPHNNLPSFEFTDPLNR